MRKSLPLRAKTPGLPSWSVQEASLLEVSAAREREKAQKEETEGTLRQAMAELSAARKAALERGHAPEAGGR